MRPNQTNFAVTTLSGGSGGAGVTMGSGDTTFILVSATNFPTISTAPTGLANGALPYQPASFVVSIDSELILCSGISGATVTVGLRGYEGTTPASHSVGANIVLAARAGAFNQVFGALPDTHNLDVPPFTRGGWNATLNAWDYLGTSNTQLTGGSGPSIWDDEFEGPWGGNGTPWTISPAVPSWLLPGHTGGDNGAVIDLGQYRRSCLTFRRADNSATSYYFYRHIGTATAYMVTAKLSHNALQQSYTNPVECSLFLTDANAPASGAEGNMVMLSHTMAGNAQTTTYGPTAGVNNTTVDNWWITRAVYTINSDGGHTVAFGAAPAHLYYRIVFNPSTYNYGCFLGDGYTWHRIALIFRNNITPASVGLRFWAASSTSAVVTREEAVCDWIRVEAIKSTGLDAHWELA